MKRLSLVIALALCGFTAIFAQRTVTGKVTDEKGEPLIGVSIFARGTSAGTVSDVDGTFSLAVPAGANTLVFSYTGFATEEVALGASNIVDLSMKESAEQLTEVLVTAIGIQRDKKALGYSAVDLGADKLAQKSESDPIRTLTAKVPGVQVQAGGGAPGQSTRINIRGYSSLTGNTQPLFVVDGVPFDNSVNASTESVGGTQYSNRAFDIDPNNIESLTVLKGAAAAALYGSRATNGVIVITTKTGKRSMKKGLEVTYNSSYSVEQVSSLPEFQDVYGQGSNQNYNGGFIGNWGAPFPEYVDELNAQYGTNYSKTYATYPDGTAYPDGTVPHPIVGVPYTAARFKAAFPEFLDANGNAIPVPYQPFDYLDGFFQDGHLVENSLSFNAGGENTGLSATVSRMDNRGIVSNTEASRTSLSFGGNSKLTNGLIISGNVNYVNTDQSNPPLAPSYFTDYTTAYEASIFSRLYYLPRNYNLNGYPFENPVDGSNVFYRALDNPLWLTKYARYTSDLNRVFGNLALSYDLTSWLNFTARGGVNTYSESRRSILPKGGVDDANGSLWTDDLTNTETDFNYLATISRDINEDFDVRFIVGLNLNQREFTRRRVEGDNVISRGQNTVNATSTQIVRQDYLRKQRLYALYGDVQFGYKNFLYLNLVGRNDWSSTLPVNDQSYFYPGVSASFVLTDALGISNPTLGFAKLRAAYTQVGNEAPPYYTSTVYRINTPFTTTTGTVVNQATLDDVLGNATLRNELTKEIEFGADVRLFRNRLGIDVTWFKRNSIDQITRAQVPSSSGFQEAVVNAGEIENKGFELGLNIIPVKTASGFTWDNYVNFTKINSLVVDAGEGSELFIGGPLTSFGIIHREGEEYGQIFGTKNARSEDGQLLIEKELGTTIWLPESQIIGNPNPDFTLGWSTSFSFKGFTLGALLDWRQGGDIFSVTTASMVLRGVLAGSEDREGLRVIPGVYGDPTSYNPDKGTFDLLTDENGQAVKNTTPLTAFGYHFSNAFGAYGADEVNIYDATTVRLREVSLGYEFPKTLLDKTPFGSLRLSVSGRNLWFHTPNMNEYINLDPEVLTETADSNVQGLELGATPPTRRFGVNLSVSF